MNIILAVIALLSAIVTGLLTPYIRAKYSQQKVDNIYSWVKRGVQAAEQVLKIVDPTGEKRKEFVITYLNKKGIKITGYDREIFIESAVNELNIEQKSFIKTSS